MFDMFCITSLTVIKRNITFVVEFVYTLEGSQYNHHWTTLSWLVLGGIGFGQLQFVQSVVTEFKFA